MWFPIVNARFWLFDSKGGTKILTKTPSLRWKLNKTLRSEHGYVASVFRKWLREAKSLLFTLFGVSPVSCSVFGKCAVCVWFIKLLTVIYATFVHTIITGISEFFFVQLQHPSLEPGSFLSITLVIISMKKKKTHTQSTNSRCVPVYHRADPLEMMHTHIQKNTLENTFLPSKWEIN